VHASYLDHAGPRPLEVLRWLSVSGCRRAVVVPLLLTAAYHGKVDIPAVVREASSLDLDIALADVLGPVSDLLVAGLVRRLPTTELDAVVLAAAGTRDAAARTTVAAAAEALGARLGLPCTVAYASAAPPTADVAVAALPGRVGVASYFLAPGLLFDKAVEAALAAGAVAVAPPLEDAPELVTLIEHRVAAALNAGLVAA
jgi:sirohydrochlorin ferrochelatase